jgi:hypothetical protein
MHARVPSSEVSETCSPGHMEPRALTLRIRQCTAQCTCCSCMPLQNPTMPYAHHDPQAYASSASQGLEAHAAYPAAAVVRGPADGNVHVRAGQSKGAQRRFLSLQSSCAPAPLRRAHVTVQRPCMRCVLHWRPRTTPRACAVPHNRLPTLPKRARSPKLRAGDPKLSLVAGERHVCERFETEVTWPFVPQYKVQFTDQRLIIACTYTFLFCFKENWEVSLMYRCASASAAQRGRCAAKRAPPRVSVCGRQRRYCAPHAACACDALN